MKYLLLTLMFLPIVSKAEIPLEIIGNDSTLNDIIVRLDLLRVCSNPTDNNPNFHIQRNGNIIDLRISITYSDVIPCDPPPPQFASDIEINLGRLDSGDYQLNIVFVDSDESVITGTPLVLNPYHEPFYFHVPYSVPVMNWRLSLMLLTILLITANSNLQNRIQ